MNLAATSASRKLPRSRPLAREDSRGGYCIAAIDRELIYVVMAGTELEGAAGELGLRMAREIYADRAYDDTGNLVSRKLPGAVRSICPIGDLRGGKDEWPSGVESSPLAMPGRWCAVPRVAIQMLGRY